MQPNTQAGRCVYCAGTVTVGEGQQVMVRGQITAVRHGLTPSKCPLSPRKFGDCWGGAA